jgi:Sulfotransferase domain
VDAHPRLPNFVIIGAPKAGTTSLHRYLGSHPQVFVSETKELNFFIANMNWRRGVDWYMEQFAPAGDARAIGESSPRYTQHPDYRGVAARAAALIPHARLIYLVRNPLDQMVSHYQDRLRWRSERLPLERALCDNPIYLGTASYGFQLEQFLEHFPRERILVVASESLREVDTRAETLTRVLRFLNVDESWTSETWTREHNVAYPARRRLLQRLSTTRVWDHATALVPARVKEIARPVTHRRPGRLELAPTLRRRLERSLRDDVARFRALVGDDFDGWGIA